MPTVYLREETPQEAIQNSVIKSITDSMNPMHRAISSFTKAKLDTIAWQERYAFGAEQGWCETKRVYFANKNTLEGYKEPGSK